MTSTSSRFVARLPAAALAFALSLPALAHAQLHLPGLPGVASGLRSPLSRLSSTLDASLDRTLAPLDLVGERLAEIARQVQAHPRELARDPRGELVVRGELLAAPSSPAARAALRDAGFAVLREDVEEGLDLAWLVLGPPAGTALADAVDRARALDPDGAYDYHHVYLGGGVAGMAAAGAVVGPAVGADPPPGGGGLRVGLVDSGVDESHPVFRDARLLRHGCADGPHPAAHGTAVASLLVGEADAFRSAAPRATLYAGDAYCGAPTGGSVEAVARELAWMARERVAVVNVSLVGPANQILQRVVAQAIARGMAIVAAAGNDGPAAPPLYPASWPGVVGVGAVDGRGRLLPEGARGPQVMFVAPGADMAAAAWRSRDFVPVRGTSFAAPLVAGLLAARHRLPDAADSRAALAALADLARQQAGGGDVAAKDGFGRGLVGMDLRTPPDAVRLVRDR